MKKIDVINILYTKLEACSEYDVILGKTFNDEIVEIIIKKVKMVEYQC